MDYHDKQKARVGIAHKLMSDGWNLHGYHEDASDMMTDYYSPAYWHGIAVKGNAVMVCGESAPREAHDLSKDNIVMVACSACAGTGIEPGTDAWNLQTARANPEGFHKFFDNLKGGDGISLMRTVVSPLHFNDDGTLKCQRCHGNEKIIDHAQTTKEVTGHYPAHSGNKKRVQFHLEIDGVIVKEWFALKSYLIGSNDHDGSRKKEVENELSDLVKLIEQLSTKKNAVITAKNDNGETGIEIVQYNEKCIAVFGDTKQYMNEFSRKRGGIGGIFNGRLTHNGEKQAGWIFKNNLLEQVESITGTKI